MGRSAIALLLTQLVAVATAFGVATRAIPRSLRTATPQMSMNGLPPMAGIDASTALLAAEELRKTLKSPGDELIDEIFINFPTALTGAVLAFFVVEYAKKLQGRMNISALDVIFKDYFVFIAVPAFTALFVVAANLGVLNGASGILAKGLLDGWNVFATAALPGAILKY